MSDYRMSIIRNVEAAMAGKFSSDQVATISNILIKNLSEYEISKRCTDIIQTDNGNQRIIRRYLACMSVDGRSDKTIKQYRYVLNGFDMFIGKSLAGGGPSVLRFFFGSEKERGVRNSTLETRRAIYSTFFQWLVDEEIIEKNPMKTIKPIKCVEEVKKGFSDVEMDAMRSACQTFKERAILEMLITTGVRVSEMCNMEISDIDMQTLSVHVKHGKGGKERITYTTAVGAKHINRYLSSRNETDGTALFYNEKHTVLTERGVQYILKKIAEKAGVTDVHPHRFRRTFATNLSRRGMEIQEIQRLLGHTNINTTMIYVNLDDGNIRESYKKHIA